MKEKGLPQVIQQANQYVSSYFNQWTPAERRTVLALAAAMQSGDKEDVSYRVDLSVILTAVEHRSSSRYSLVKSACYRLLSRKVFHEDIQVDGKKKLIGSNLVSEITYIDGETAVTIEPTPAARRYFQQLKNTFTMVPLQQSMRLSQFSHARLHELLLQFQSTGWRQIPIEDLRPMLGLAQLDDQGKIVRQKYRTTGELLKHVIYPAIREIEANTSMQNIRVKQIKQGKRIVSLRFDFQVLSIPRPPKPQASGNQGIPLPFVLEAVPDPLTLLANLSQEEQDRLRREVTETAVPFLPATVRNDPERLEAAIRECMAATMVDDWSK